KVSAPKLAASAASISLRNTASSGCRPQAATNTQSIKVASKRNMSEPSNEWQGNEHREHHHVHDIHQEGARNGNHNKRFGRMTMATRDCLHIGNGRRRGTQAEAAECRRDYGGLVILADDAEYRPGRIHHTDNR